MNVLELKGELHELISQVSDESSAKKLLAIIKSFLQERAVEEQQGDDFEDRMTPEQVKALERAIARSYERSNFISSQETKEKLSQWLKP